MAVISQSKLRIDLRFRALAIIGTSGVFATALLSVGFAATRLIWPHSPVGGAMSLVLPRPIVSMGLMVASFVCSGARLKMRPQFRRWSFVLRDSRYFFFTTFFNTILMQGDYMLAGLFFDTKRVGAYYFAYNLSTQSLQLVNSSASGVLLPSFAKLDREPERQHAAFMRVCSILLIVGAIGCLVQGIMGGALLHLVYKSKWNESIPLFQILTIGMIFLLPGQTGTNLMLAQGRFRRVMAWSGTIAVLFLFSVAMGASTGTTKGIAVGVALFFTVCGPLCVVAPFGFTVASFREVVRRVYAFPVMLVAVSGLAAWGGWMAVGGGPEIIRSAVAAVVAGSVYGAGAYIWRRAELRDLTSRFTPYLAKVFRVRPLGS